MKNYMHSISLKWQVSGKNIFLFFRGFCLPLFLSLFFFVPFFAEANSPTPPTNLRIATDITVSGYIFRGDDTTKTTRTITVEAFETSNPTPIASVVTPTGFYRLTLPVEFTGTIKPIGTDITFSPASIDFPLNTPNPYVNNNFAALYSFYVDKTGNDSNSGTEASPFLNIQAAARVVFPGDRVYIKAGTYISSDIGCGAPGCGNWKATPVLKVTRDGTQNRPILFEAFGTDIVTVDGRGINKAGISIESDYITVSKMIAINATGPGIRMLASWRTTGTRQPIAGPPVFSGASTGRKVTGSRVVESIAHNNSMAPTGFSAGIQVLGQVDNCVIESSASYQNGGGINFREYDAILYKRDYSLLTNRNPWPDAPRDCIVRNNLVFDNKKNDENSDGIGGRYPTNMIYENNISVNNADDNFDTIGAVNTKFIGNVAVNANPDRTTAGDGNGFKIATRKGGGNTILNNISLLNPRAGYDDNDGTDNIYQNNIAYKNVWLGFGIESDLGSHTLQNNLSYLNGIDVTLSIDCPNAPPFAPHATDHNYWGDGKPPLNACGKVPYNDINSLSNTSSTYGLLAVGTPGFVMPIDTISELDLSGLDTITPGNIGALVDNILTQVRDAFTLQSGSQLIDRGTAVGLPFSGTAPDIGAVETVIE